jgi:spermidine/putrescine transport system permease protein
MRKVLRLVMYLWVAAACACAMPPASAQSPLAIGFEEAFTPDFLRRDLPTFKAELVLDEEQAAIFDSLLGDYHEQFVRSLVYAGIATAACLVLAYPLVYWIAFRAGPWRNLFLVFIVAPFFVTYLVRTLAWLNILADQGPVVGLLRDVHILDSDGRLLATTFAVVSGITYNFFPFMALPIYVSLEQIDPRLLTFIPAAGDFINAALLGTPNQAMIGNVIQSKFLESLDYPGAASLSFVLMGLILVMLLIYARIVGSERLTG